jgi:hypothetical protein
MARYLVYHPPFKFLRGPIAGLLPRSNPDGQRPDAFILCDTNMTLFRPSLMWVMLETQSVTQLNLIAQG